MTNLKALTSHLREADKIGIHGNRRLEFLWRFSTVCEMFRRKLTRIFEKGASGAFYGQKREVVIIYFDRWAGGAINTSVTGFNCAGGNGG